MRFPKFKTPAGAEFEERQLCLPLWGRASRIVLPIIVKLRKDLRAWEKPARRIVKRVSNGVLPLFFPEVSRGLPLTLR